MKALVTCIFFILPFWNAIGQEIEYEEFNAISGSFPHRYQNETVQLTDFKSGRSHMRVASFPLVSQLKFMRYDFNQTTNNYAPTAQVHRYFREDGHITMELRLNAQGSDTLAKFHYSYDSAGRQTDWRLYVKDSASYNLRNRNAFSYFPNGAIRTKTSYQPFARVGYDTLQHVEYYSNQLDNNGRPIGQVYKRKDILYYYNTSTPERASITSYERDSIAYVGLGFYAPRMHWWKVGVFQNLSQPGNWKIYEYENMADSVNRVKGDLLKYSINGSLNTLRYSRVVRQINSTLFIGSIFEYNGNFVVEKGSVTFRLQPLLSMSDNNLNPQIWMGLTEWNPVVVSRNTVREEVDRNVMASPYYSADSVVFDSNNELLSREHFMQSGNDTTITPYASYKMVLLNRVLSIPPIQSPQPVIIARTSLANTLKVLGLTKGQWQATIVDMQGRSVQQSPFPSNAEFGVERLSPGSYILTLTSKKGEAKRARFSW